LLKKNHALSDTWRRYQLASSLEHFVELAVSVNSFTEFLIDKGVTALHHTSHQLEQAVLLLFSSEVLHPLPQATLDSLNQRIHGLERMTREHVAAASDLIGRKDDSSHAAQCVWEDQTWLISNEPAAWKELQTQLAYLGLAASVVSWEQPLPKNAGAAPLLLLDMKSLPVAEWGNRIQALRQQFEMGRLICLGMEPGFDQLQQTLRAGCDSCQLDGMQTHAIVERIMDVNERYAQEDYRVLIVEDSKTASHLIRRTLEENQIVSEIVNDPRQTLDALKNFHPDLILMDMHMPGCTGVEVARIIRQHGEFLSIPIVYLSGETNIALQVDAMRLGGDHFLTKPFNPVFLNAIVKSKIERYRALRRTMYHDSLTGLLNHSSGKSTLDMVLSSAIHEGDFLSVVMLDIDHFKQINDTYGHPTGDQVIRSLAWLLKKRLRKQDVVCRYGGEEFLIGLPHTDAEQASAIVNRIRYDFGKLRHVYRDTYFSASISGGIANYPRHKTGDMLIKAADEALYKAKHDGRNRIHSASA
jgi:diguanylate cyclase (GGDEF)-like protein